MNSDYWGWDVVSQLTHENTPILGDVLAEVGRLAAPRFLFGEPPDIEFERAMQDYLNGEGGSIRIAALAIQQAIRLRAEGV